MLNEPTKNRLKAPEWSAHAAYYSHRNEQYEPSTHDVQPLLQAKCDLTMTWAQASIMQLRTKHG
jgi:hypothetical protein